MAAARAREYARAAVQLAGRYPGSGETRARLVTWAAELRERSGLRPDDRAQERGDRALLQPRIGGDVSDRDARGELEGKLRRIAQRCAAQPGAFNPRKASLAELVAVELFASDG